MTSQQDGLDLKTKLLFYCWSYALSSVLYACHEGSCDACPHITEQCMGRTPVLLQALFNFYMNMSVISVCWSHGHHYPTTFKI